MGKERINLGRSGEKIAARFLKRNGYVILERNFSCLFGEIDIIARDGESIVFVEVRTKGSDEFGLPMESVQESKQRRLIKVAWSYIKSHKLYNAYFRFDLVSILVRQEGKPQICLIKDAFRVS